MSVLIEKRGVRSLWDDGLVAEAQIYVALSVLGQDVTRMDKVLEAGGLTSEQITTFKESARGITGEQAVRSLRFNVGLIREGLVIDPNISYRALAVFGRDPDGSLIPNGSAMKSLALTRKMPGA